MIQQQEIIHRMQLIQLMQINYTDVMQLRHFCGIFVTKSFLRAHLLQVNSAAQKTLRLDLAKNALLRNISYKV
jgi:hypothetical protein